MRARSRSSDLLMQSYELFGALVTVVVEFGKNFFRGWQGMYGANVPDGKPKSARVCHAECSQPLLVFFMQ